MTCPGPLTQTLVPHHLCTPTVAFLEYLTNSVNPILGRPPRPLKEQRSQESNHPPARNRSINARWAGLRGPPSSPELSHPTSSSPRSDSRRLPVFWLKRLDKSLPEVQLPEEWVDSLEELSDPSQLILKWRPSHWRLKITLRWWYGCDFHSSMLDETLSVRTTSAEGSSGEGLLRDAQNTSQARTRE